CQETSNALTF
nr:immunoglobulin light chain junction region [Macaca mulatta]